MEVVNWDQRLPESREMTVQWVGKSDSSSSATRIIQNPFRRGDLWEVPTHKRRMSTDEAKAYTSSLFMK